eukprot:Nitzschia sp. Nitz4//scaffold18_size181773//151656//156065//NITZ4_001938-RA/size181773-processed-gene-0.67-mRNA-1//-1//CDS//3329540080//3500//frame0
MARPTLGTSRSNSVAASISKNAALLSTSSHHSTPLFRNSSHHSTSTGDRNPRQQPQHYSSSGRSSGDEDEGVEDFGGDDDASETSHEMINESQHMQRLRQRRLSVDSVESMFGSHSSLGNSFEDGLLDEDEAPTYNPTQAQYLFSEKDLLGLNQPSKLLYGRKLQAQRLERMRDALTLPRRNSSSKVISSMARRVPLRVCLVRGSSGSGKTALCQQVLRSHLQEITTTTSTMMTVAAEQQTTITAAKSTRPYYYIEWKHDQVHGQATPFRSIIMALDSLGKQLLKDGTAEKHHDLLRACFAFEGSILIPFVPSFSKLFASEETAPADDNTNSSDPAAAPPPTMTVPKMERTQSTMYLAEHVKGATTTEDRNPMNMASERIAVALRTFLQVFCTTIKPICWFWDDVQWCDSSTLEMVLSLLKDSQRPINNCLLVFGYRDDPMHLEYLQDFLLNIQQLRYSPTLGFSQHETLSEEQSDTEQGSSSMTLTMPEKGDAPKAIPDTRISMDGSTLLCWEISLGDLDKESLGEWIAAMTKKNDEKTKQLVDLIYSKTNGNCYYVKELIKQLQDMDILTYNVLTAEWECDMMEAKAVTDISDNVVDVVTQRIQSLPKDVIRMLQLAACLGFYVDIDVLGVLEQAVSTDGGFRSVSADFSLASFGELESEETLAENDLQESQVSFGSKGRRMNWKHKMRAQSAAQLSLDQDIANAELNGSMGSFGSKGKRRRRAVRANSADGFERELNELQEDPSPGSKGRKKQLKRKLKEKSPLSRCLEIAEEEGFIEVDGKLLRFSHDRVQEAFYELTSANGRETAALHFSIGRYLEQYRNSQELIMSATDSDRYLFLAVSQLNRGQSLYPEDEVWTLALLNWEASILAKETAGIENASYFLRTATEIIASHPNFWKENYEVVLEIINSFAEVEFSLGRLESSLETINVVLENVRIKLDRVRALVVRCEVLGIQRRFVDAIKQGVELLAILGEKLPHANPLSVAIEFQRVRGDCRNKSDEFFSEMAEASNPKRNAAMKVLRICSLYALNCNQLNVASLMFLRAMRLTIREGFCSSTPWIFSGYGAMLAWVGDNEAAIRFGQLAYSTGKRRKETIPSGTLLSLGSVLHMQVPLNLTLEPYLTGYRVGLETGDLLSGTSCLSVYAMVYFTCGLPLGSFASDMRNFCTQLRILGQDIALAYTLPSTQFALNLLLKSDDPVDLTHESILRNQPNFFTPLLREDDSAKSRTARMDVLFHWYLQLFNAYLMRDGKLTYDTLKRIQALRPGARRFGGLHFMNYVFSFIDGLVGLYLSRTYVKSSGRKSGKRIAKKALHDLKVLSQKPVINCIPMMRFLEVETSVASDSTSIAKERYDDVISGFGRIGHVHFSAIAHELAGEFMASRNEHFWAEHYIQQAAKLYSEWNAYAKVQQMYEVDTHRATRYMADQESSEMTTNRNASIQGKRRFNWRRDIVGGMSQASAVSTTGSAS